MSLRAGSHDRLQRGTADLGQAIVSVDEQNVVADDDAGQGDQGVPPMTMPKDWPVSNSPRNTPIVDIATAVRTRKVEEKLLNCAARLKAMSSTAKANALTMKA